MSFLKSVISLKLAKINTLLFCLGLTLPALSQMDLVRYYYSEPHLGTLVSLTAYHDDSHEIEAISKEMFALLDDLNKVYSDYLSDSEVGKINLASARERQHQLSPELLRILVRSQELTQISLGYFDPYIGSLTHLWKEAFRKNKFPSRRQVKRALKRSGHKRTELRVEQSSLLMHKKSMELDFGGIGKGFIGDELATFLKGKGLDIFLLDLGGDLIAADAPPGKESWHIGISTGLEVQLRNEAIATSGSTFQYLIHKGKKYSHLINPKTGYGLGDNIVSTVLAPNGSSADALASALVFMDGKTRELLFTGKEDQGYIIFQEGTELEISPLMRKKIE